MSITFESLAEEALTTWPSLDAARMERALQIASNRTSIYNANCPTGCFDVRGSKGWYRVNTNTRSCTCTDSMTGHICKHRLAVWLYIQVRVRPIVTVRKSNETQIMKELGYA